MLLYIANNSVKLTVEYIENTTINNIKKKGSLSAII